MMVTAREKVDAAKNNLYVALLELPASEMSEVENAIGLLLLNDDDVVQMISEHMKRIREGFGNDGTQRSE